jgi:battenin
LRLPGALTRRARRQLVYQATVCASRSSLALGLPALPPRLLPLPALVQAGILALLGVEAARGVFAGQSDGGAAAGVFLLVALEGVCGGLA